MDARQPFNRMFNIYIKICKHVHQVIEFLLQFVYSNISLRHLLNSLPSMP